MLGLRPRLALATSIGLTVVAPLSIPGFGALLGLDAAVDVLRLAKHLALIVLPAAGVACLALRARAPIARLLPSGQAASGVAVVGLVIVGLAMADGVRAHWAVSPRAFLICLAMAVIGNLGLCLIGAALFASRGRAYALTAGLVGGNRNVTLAWAAAGNSLSTTAEAYVAASIVPILALPLVLKSILILCRSWHGLARSWGRQLEGKGKVVTSIRHHPS